MGIIMEFGASIPLTPAFSSGLDALTDGIAESTKTGGPAALAKAIDAFSAADAGTKGIAWGGPTMPAIAESAGFPSPGDFMSQIKSMSANNQSFLGIRGHLQDPKFNQGAALAACASNLFGGKGIVDNLVGKEGLLAEALGGVPFPSTSPVTSPRDPATAGIVHELPQGSQASQLAEQGIIIMDKPPSTPGGDRGIVIGTKTGDPGSERGVIVTGGKAFGDPVSPQNPVELKGIIVPPQNPVELKGVIAPPQLPDPGAERGIILVGGKGFGDPATNTTEQSRFGIAIENMPANPGFAAQGTLDDTLGQLQNLDPYTPQGQQTLSVFQEQLEVLNGMEGTVKNQVSLQLQMNNLMRGKILG